MYQERVGGMSHLPGSMLSCREMTWGFQSKLYQKARQSSYCKFYILYDRMFLRYILQSAWDEVRSNGGAPGVDHISIEDVETFGVDDYLSAPGEELRCRTCRPDAVKHVWIPKPNGGKTPNGYSHRAGQDCSGRV
jgi:retron-type reverse transcriptase